MLQGLKGILLQAIIKHPRYTQGTMQVHVSPVSLLVRIFSRVLYAKHLTAREELRTCLPRK